MSTDLIPADEYTDYAEQGGGNYEKMKEIRLCVDLQKDARQAGIPLGHFFIFDPNVDQGQDPVLIDIGPEIKDAVILRDAKIVKVWGEWKGKEQTIVSSTEFRANTDPIVLFDKTVTDGTEEIVACLMYTNPQDPNMSIKGLKATRYPDLRQSYVCYLLIGGEIYRMAFAATDNTGAKKEGGKMKPLDFDAYLPDSFLGVKHAMHKDTPNMTHLHTVRIFSKPPFEKSVDFIKAFEVTGRLTMARKEEIDNALSELTKHVEGRFSRKIIKAWQKTMDKDAIVCYDPRHIAYIAQHPSILIQKEKLPRLDPSVIVPELASGEKRAAPSEASGVIDVETDFDSMPDQKKPSFTTVPPKPAPRNRKEAVAQKREEREEVEDSGVGMAAAAGAAETRLKKETEDKMKDEGLQEFLAATDTSKPAPTDDPY